MPKGAEIFEVPPYILTEEENRRRQEHQRRMEEERKRLQLEAEKRKRYRLQKQAELKRIREIKKRRARVVKIVIGGIVVTVMGAILVNSILTSAESKAVEQDPYGIVVIGDSENLPPIDDSYQIPVTESVSEEAVDIINIDLSYEARKASIDTSGKFGVGSEVNDYFFLVLNNNESTYNLFLKYGKMYGVDPYILMAKAFQESSFSHNSCLPGGKNYNGYGVGIMQHETPDGRAVVAHNYITGEDDVMYLTMSNAVDLEKNIQMGAMHFQKCLENNNGNLLLALQAYNYGQGMVDAILRDYAAQKGTTVDAVRISYYDTGWLTLVNEAHNNPCKYIDSWSGTYGDAQYIQHVLRYFIGSDTYYYYGDEKIVFDLNTFEAIKVNENVKVIS